eukprot:3181005-Prymnesium_polylepis.1
MRPSPLRARRPLAPLESCPSHRTHGDVALMARQQRATLEHERVGGRAVKKQRGRSSRMLRLNALRLGPARTTARAS